MASQHYRSPFGDTTYTKIFVGGLAWETQTDVMRRYFEQFGEILEAVIITDKNTAKSKGYGFVTFRDPESARNACVEANPVIDGRRANCNIASLGRPRPSPPRGRNQRGNYEGVAGSVPPFPPQAPLIYPHAAAAAAAYGYTSFSPGYGYHQSIYNPQLQQQQYYPQVYGGTGTSSTGMGINPYYYGGYSMQQVASPRPQRFQQGPSYLYYPTHMDGSFSYPPTPLPILHQPRTTFNTSATESQTPHQTTEVEEAETSSESPNT